MNRASFKTSVVVATLLLGLGSAARAADPIVGVWIADAARVDCNSGAVLASFKGMQVFHHGGTLTDTNSAAPTTRGPGFGTWWRDGEHYVARFRFARYFPDGNLDGYTVVTRTAVLGDGGDMAMATSTIEIRNASDFVVARACARDTAQRLQ
jgi:hypothetical protein